MNNVINTRTKSNIVLAVFALLLSFQGIGQQWTYEYDGIHQFNSLQQAQNLSFYLFDDGYHSFTHNPRHQYSTSHNTPVHFSAEPNKSGNDVDELVMNETTEYETNAVISPANTDNQITIKRSWELVEGNDNYFIITFENTKYDTPISGCIEFHFSKDDSDIEANEILDDYGNNWVYQKSYEVSDYPVDFTHKYSWHFDDLEFGEQRHIYVPAGCIPEALSVVKTRAVMLIEGTENGCGTVIPYNRNQDGANSNITHGSIYTLSSFVKNNPHDPNAITAEPYGLLECDQYQTIKYTIYFHNDGEDPAVNVYLNVDIEAPYENVKLIQASDNCDLNWNNNEIGIVFPDIYLEGLEGNPSDIMDTYGAVEIEVCYDLANFTLAGLECAQVNVDIVFDFEDPIPVSNRICRDIECGGQIYSELDNAGLAGLIVGSICDDSPSYQSNYQVEGGGRFHLSRDWEFEISPNPSSDLISLYNITIDETTIIEIYSNTGQKVMSLLKDKVEGENKIDISQLETGVYFIAVTSGEGRQTKRFIKI